MMPGSLIAAASFTPNWLQSPNAWLGHAPFAGWLIREIAPAIFVELGTHSGNSYFSFCQSILENTISTKCSAVDTWLGDEHAGYYGEDIFTRVNAHNAAHYARFSRLLRMTFDEAVTCFENESIELLHIDGLHTYEAAKHDFELWLPKLAPGAVAIFHDTIVREHNFGVWKLWAELQEKFPNNLEFTHSNGLGVLQLNNAPKEKKREWLHADVSEKQKIINFFAALGSRQLERFKLNQLEQYAAETIQSAAERDGQIDGLNQALVERDGQIAHLSQAVAERDGQIAHLTQSVAEHARVTKPKTPMKRHIECWWQSMRLKFNAEDRKPAPSGIMQKTELGWIMHFVVQQLRALSRQSFRFLEKLSILRSCWQAGGWAAVRARLEFSLKMASNGPAIPKHEVQNFMQQILPLPQTGLSPEFIGPVPKVVVVIPVYRGLQETRECITSVLSGQKKIPYKIIVIDDASPEDELKDYVASLQDQLGAIRVVRNSSNLGFAATVNRGFKLAQEADVLLLNSDTIVAPGWVDRLARQAYSKNDIGTVTPFSNNATICSYPDLNGWNVLPERESVESLDRAFAEANLMKNVQIPTAVGFCMYIKRTCLKDVGQFDDKAFGGGYGEENDFCLRATKKGWSHILAADVFVFHAGEKSFGDSATQKKDTAMKLLRRKYPDYEACVMKHITSNPSQAFVVAATAARYRLGEKPVLLFFTHSLGGGTEKHVRCLAAEISSSSRVLILRPLSQSDDNADLLLEACDSRDSLQIRLSSANMKLLANVLQLFGVTRGHIHHVLGFSFSVENLLALLAIPFDFTVHDYMSICPRVNLFLPRTGYCENPEPSKCNQCIMRAPMPPSGQTEILYWRTRFASLINGAKRVICPSRDAMSRVLQYFPRAAITFVPHEPHENFHANVVVSRPAAMRRIAVLGGLSECKGLRLMENLSKEIKKKSLPLRIQIIGHSARPFSEKAYVVETGPYKDENLLEVIERMNPDIILFPALWPETYSYTLSAALRSGRFIVATDIGAFPERLRDNPLAKLVPVKISAADLAALLTSVDLNPPRDIPNFDKKHTCEKVGKTLLSPGASLHPFYLTDYLLPPK
jgi:GT2 family glycosyltransferase/glycosyltransferase involved in cell wall biosynthesis